MHKILIICFVVLVSSGISHAQSKAVDSFLENNSKDFSALYFYESTLRMLAKIAGGDLGDDVKRIKSARLIFTASDSIPNLQTTFSTFNESLEKEGFHSLIEMNSTEGSVKASMAENEDGPYAWFFNFTADGNNYMVEIYGDLDISFAQKMMTMDLSSITDLIIEKPQPKKVKENQEQ